MNAKRLIRSTMTVSFWTFISRVLGFVRDMLFAKLIGVNLAFDAYIVATKIPNFMRQLFAEGAFSQAFVPVLSEYKEKYPKDLQRFVQSLLGLLTLGLVVVLALGMLFAKSCVLWFAPGLAQNPEQWQLASHLLQMTFPYLLFIAWVAFSSAVLNTFNRFTVMAITPLLLNACLISFVLIQPVRHWLLIENLALALTLAGVLQWLLQLPFLSKEKITFRPRLDWQHPGVKQVLALMVPGLFGVSVAQISMVIDTWFASYLPTGSISWLYYSDRLTYFPLGIFGFAIASVILPSLAKAHTRGDNASKTLDWGIKVVLFLGLPASIGLVLLAGPIIMVLFHHGAFSMQDVQMTEFSLMAYGAGLPAFMLIKVLASAFYARKDIKTPVKIAALALVVNIIGNMALVGPMQHAGLALATTLAACVNASCLALVLLRRGWWQVQSGWMRWLCALLVSLSALVAVLLSQDITLEHWLELEGMQPWWNLFALISVAVVVYLFTLMGLKGFGPLYPQQVNQATQGDVSCK